MKIPNQHHAVIRAQHPEYILLIKPLISPLFIANEYIVHTDPRTDLEMTYQTLLFEPAQGTATYITLQLTVMNKMELFCSNSQHITRQPLCAIPIALATGYTIHMLPIETAPVSASRTIYLIWSSAQCTIYQYLYTSGNPIAKITQLKSLLVVFN